jgi:hypothetical protein
MTLLYCNPLIIEIGDNNCFIIKFEEFEGGKKHLVITGAYTTDENVVASIEVDDKHESESKWEGKVIFVNRKPVDFAGADRA